MSGEPLSAGGLEPIAAGPSSEEAGRLSALSGQQLALLQELQELDRAPGSRGYSLAVMYQGGLAVFENSGHADRFAQCAHSLRELMEKIPECLDVPMRAQGERLTVKVRELEGSFAGARESTGCFSESNGWHGRVDRHLRSFLLRADGFFEWFASHYPRRRAEAQSALMRLDSSGRPLPEPLGSLNVDAWFAMREYFQSVAHHRRVAEEGELRGWVDALERFLLERLVPRTFDDFDEIDRLLAGEADGA